MRPISRLLSLCGLASVLACGGGGGGGDTKPSVSVSISPARAVLSTGGSLNFSSTVVSSSSDTRLNWSCTAGSIDAGGTYQAPSTPGTYTITATSVANSSSRATATAEVLFPPQIASFAVDSPQIWMGDHTTLRWSVLNAETVTLQPGGQTLPAQGTVDLAPATGVTYTLTATTRAASVNATVTLDVRTAGQWVLASDQVLGGSPTLLPDGRIFISRYGANPFLFDPLSRALTTTSSPTGTPFYSGASEPVTLKDGRVFMTASDGGVLYYNSGTDSWTRGTAGGPMGMGQDLLSDGRLLVRDFVNSAWVWGLHDPLTNAYTPLATPGNVFIPKLTAGNLPDGRLLMVGTESPYRNAPSFFAFDPLLATWTPLTFSGLPPGLFPDVSGFQMLENGKVLLLGVDYYNSYKSAYVLDPVALTATRTGDTQTSGSRVTRLNDGRVLVASGIQAEIFDPGMGVFTRTQDFEYAGGMGKGIPLPDGRVFILVESRAYFFKPSVRPSAAPSPGSVATTGALNVARRSSSLLRISNGQIIASGGSLNAVTSKAVERFDPATGTWTRLGDMLAARIDHAVAQLPNGQLLIVGGGGGYNTTEPFAEIYDPQTGTTAAHPYQDFGFHVTGGRPLPDGRILFLMSWSGSGYKTLVYDPADGSFTPGAFSTTDHYGGAITQLPNGDLLCLGKSSAYNSGPGIEVVHHDTLAWETVASDPRISTERAMALLPDGRYLLVGSSLILDPATWTFSQTGSTLGWSGLQQVLPLPGGRALALTPANNTALLMVFDPSLEDGFGGWIPGPALPSGFVSPGMVALGDGRVLLTSPAGSQLYTP